MEVCQNQVLERMSHVVIIIGEHRYTYCSTIHFLNDEDIKLITKELESTVRLYVEILMMLKANITII